MTRPPNFRTQKSCGNCAHSNFDYDGGVCTLHVQEKDTDPDVWYYGFFIVYENEICDDWKKRGKK